MKIKVSEPKKSEVTLTIEAEETDLEKYMVRAVKELSQQVSVKGFRKGKVPRDVLEQQLGEGAIRAHALDLALPILYAEAVLNEKLPVVEKPTVKFISDTPFVFEATVAILPKVEISGYDKIKIKEEKVEVTDKEVEDLINYFRKERAETKEVNRPAQMGDRVELDFAGFDPEGDVPLEGTESKNHPVVLGEGSLIPGFEEEVVGLKKDEEKTFKLTFPKDYHSKKFQGKKVKFNVKVQRIEEVKLPEVTSEWIKAVTGMDRTPETFRQDVRTNLEQEREMQAKAKRENQFLDELVKLGKMDVPDSLIERDIDFMIDRTKMDIESRGLAWDQYKKYLETQKRDLRAEKKEKAEKQVKLRIILQHLYEVEKIEASEVEVGERLESMLVNTPKSEHVMIRKNYKKGTEGYAQLENAIRLEKLLAKFLS